MARHHLVPQMLLRRFAADGKLRATQRDDGTVVLMTVSKACAEVGFYDLELQEGYQDEYPVDFVERALSDFEGRAAPIIGDLCGGHVRLSDQQRYDLTLCVAFQLARGWAFRDDITNAATELVRVEFKGKVTRDSVRRWLRQRGDPHDDESVEEFYRRATDERSWKLVPSKGTMVQLMLRAVLEDVHPHLFLTRRLRVLRFPEDLLTRVISRQSSGHGPPATSRSGHSES